MASFQKRLIFKKNKVGKLICKTNASTIFEGVNIIEKEHIAMKFKNIGGKYNFLDSNY